MYMHLFFWREVQSRDRSQRDVSIHLLYRCILKETNQEFSRRTSWSVVVLTPPKTPRNKKSPIFSLHYYISSRSASRLCKLVLIISLSLCVVLSFRNKVSSLVHSIIIISQIMCMHIKTLIPPYRDFISFYTLAYNNETCTYSATLFHSKSLLLQL